jgi:hypothetical protein
MTLATILIFAVSAYGAVVAYRAYRRVSREVDEFVEEAMPRMRVYRQRRKIHTNERN